MLTERLEVNGREYVQTAVAAEYVGYSDEYVQQLARGKWIDASVIQGVYYVDLQSLTRFVALSEQDRYEKAAQKDRRRRADDLLAKARVDEMEQGAGDTWVVFTKTGIVTLCGLLVGLLVWTSVQEGVEIADISAGMRASTGQLANLVEIQDIVEYLRALWHQFWGTEAVVGTAATVFPSAPTSQFSDPVVEIARTSSTVTVAPVLPDGSLGNVVTIPAQ